MVIQLNCAILLGYYSKTNSCFFYHYLFLNKTRSDTRTGISRVQLGRGSNGRQGWGCRIHDNIHSFLLGRGSNAKTARVQYWEHVGPTDEPTDGPT